MELGFRPGAATYWIPIKRYAFTQYDHWEEPKRYRIPVFYIEARKSSNRISFPLNTYYVKAVGLDIDPIADELSALGFRPSGKHRNLVIDLRTCNDQEFFNELFDLVVRIADEFEETLDQA
jgi:hypothetical protein